MIFLSRFTIFAIAVIVSSCGIKGNPLSPSEVKTLDKKNPIFALTSDENDNQKNKDDKKKYLSTSELGYLGYEYSANFGVKNDNLNDVLGRIKPTSALRKKRTIIPLQY